MSSRPDPFRLSLAWKVTLAFGFVVLAALLAFSILANRAAAREVRGFMFSGGMTDNALLAEDLAAYYRVNGSWQGVAPLLADASPWRRMMRAMAPAHEVGGRPGVREELPGSSNLSDAEGRIVAGTPPLGRLVGAADLSSGTPIRIDGQVVGYLIASESSESTLAETLVGRVTRGTWLVAGLTGLAALLAGGLLVSGLLRPVRELTAASRDLAAGDLARRVAVRSQDEVGELSAAFNQMAENLEKAEQVRRDMTADIAHELRNPLAVLQANVEALADGVYPATPEAFGAVLDQTRLLNRLVEDLRTLALADAGQLQLDMVPTDLMEVARRVVDGHAQQAEGLGVELRLGGQAAPAVVDPMRVEQILGNLLANAIRHSVRGRAVHLHVGRAPSTNRVVISVADEGEGIPDDVLPRVFERFYRGDRSRSRSEGGTGLGLAIARQLAVIQGGEIRAANRAEAGAEFTLSFPASGDLSS